MNDLTFNRAPVSESPGNPGGELGAGGSPLLLRLLRIAKRWKWLLLGAVAIAVIAGMLITLLMTPLYTAEARLEIQRENYRIVEVRGVEPESSAVDLEFYQTQYSLLRGRSLAERVATDLRLYDNVGFFEMFGADEIVEQLNQGGAANASAAARQARIRTAGVILLRNFEVRPIRMSRLVDIEFTSPDPALSAQVVNAWASRFIETTLARKFEATSYARTFLEQRLDQLRQRLEETERTLVGYAEQQRIINIPSASADGSTVSERPLIADDLATLNRELNQARADRLAAESRLRSNGGSTIEGLQNQAISTMRARRAELAADHARMLTQFEADYPPAVALANQISELDRGIAREEGRVGNTLQNNFNVATARENALQRRVEGLQADLLDLRGRTIQYNIYQREVDTNRQLYDALLQRYKEIGVAGGVGVNNISVVDEAQVPLLPSSPRLLINLVLALFLGGAIGVGLAFALEQIDEAISDPSDVEDALGLPLLGTIPKAENEDLEIELGDRKSPLVEAYLSTQTSLAFTTDHGIPRTLMVTSTRPAEGKTTTSYALARSLARTDRKVVLIDADMRSPSLHHVFEVGNERGVSNYLAGERDLAAMIHHGLSDQVALLAAGPPPPNAAELLTGDRIGQLVQELSQMFDHVIIDAPPVMGLADSPLIANQVEGVVFVIQSHATRTSVARVAIGRLKDARARLLGVLLTKFETKRAHYGYGYDYGYGYGESGKKTA